MKYVALEVNILFYLFILCYLYHIPEHSFTQVLTQFRKLLSHKLNKLKYNVKWIHTKHQLRKILKPHAKICIDPHQGTSSNNKMRMISMYREQKYFLR